MSLATQNLHCDPDERRAFAALWQSELYAKTLPVETLKARLATLRRARHGRSSEKLDRRIDLLELIIGDLEEADAEDEARQDAVGRPSSTAGRASHDRKPDGQSSRDPHHAGVGQPHRDAGRRPRVGWAGLRLQRTSPDSPGGRGPGRARREMHLHLSSVETRLQVPPVRPSTTELDAVIGEEIRRWTAARASDAPPSPNTTRTRRSKGVLAP